MFTDAEMDHGMDHVDRMGTEVWRREQVARIGQQLDEESDR